ncbi:MAG: CPBP family intramembrane metalloprotease [Puniceicoccales bacterium]|jgi:membrane protease YdiL (CAAX protease family)|nr:CPBP family intramembrane metalloprotease [Puniceicoccales bacterium]
MAPDWSGGSGSWRRQLWPSLLNCFIFFAVYFGSYAIAALLARPVYAILRQCHGRVLGPLSAYILSHSFGRIYGRLHWLALALGLFFLLLRCRLCSFRRIAAAIGKWPKCLRHFFFGFFATAVALASTVLFREWRWRCDFSLSTLAGAFAGAAFAAIGEEIVFRGLLLRLLNGIFGWRLSLTIDGLFFAFVHFEKTAMTHISGTAPTLADGFRAASDSLMAVCDTFQTIPFLSLFLLGFFLGTLFLASGDLMAPIGFHGGAAFAMLIFRRAVTVVSSTAVNAKSWLLASPVCPIFLCLLLSFYFHGNRFAKKTWSMPT